MPVPVAVAEVASLTPGGISDHVACLLVKLGQVAYRLTEDTLAQWGLRTRHYSVMQALSDEGALSQQDLVALLRIDRATMVSAVDELESKGFAARARSVDDRRRYNVTLTDGGVAVLAAIREGLDRLDAMVLADLGADERSRFDAVLRTLSGSGALVGAFDQLRGGGPNT